MDLNGLVEIAAAVTPLGAVVVLSVMAFAVIWKALDVIAKSLDAITRRK